MAARAVLLFMGQVLYYSRATGRLGYRRRLKGVGRAQVAPHLTCRGWRCARVGEGLVVEAADAGFAGEGVVVQDIAVKLVLIADGVNGDGVDYAFLHREASHGWTFTYTVFYWTRSPPQTAASSTVTKPTRTLTCSTPSGVPSS